MCVCLCKREGDGGGHEARGMRQGEGEQWFAGRGDRDLLWGLCKFDVLSGCIFPPCTNPTGYICRNNGLLYCNGLLPRGTTSSLTHTEWMCACV